MLLGYDSNTFVKVVDTISDLRTLDGSRTESVQVLGYYQAGDGGGGAFYWTYDTVSSDNYGTIIVPSLTPRTGAWKRVLDNPEQIQVAWFGVRDGSALTRADGTSSDSGAINRAIATVQDGGTLVFPGGNYRLTSPISLTGKTGVLVEGNEAILTTFAGSWTSNPMVDMTGTAAAHVNKLHVVCNLSSGQPLCGILLSRSLTSDAGGNVLESVSVLGSFTQAAVANKSDCKTRYVYCDFESTNSLPALLDTPFLNAGVPQANNGKSFWNGRLANSGAYPNSVVSLLGSCQDVTFRESQFEIANGGSVIVASDEPTHLGTSLDNVFVENCRVIGEGAASTRLLMAEHNVSRLSVVEMFWEIVGASALIEIASGVTVSNCELEFAEILVSLGTVLVNNGAVLQKSRLLLPGSAQGVSVAAGGTATANVVTTFENTFPFSGAGSYEAVDNQSNVWLMGYSSGSDTDAVRTVPAVRRRQKTNTNLATTCSVLGSSILSITNSAPTSITNFTSPQPGHDLTCVFVDGNTTIVHDPTKIHLNGSVNFVAAARSTLTLTYDATSGAWFETGRTTP